MNWFEHRPLFGQTIVVTRTRQQASDLSTKLARARRRHHRSPDDRARAAERPGRVIDALHNCAAGEYDWVVFTSANASPRRASCSCRTAATRARSARRRSPPSAKRRARRSARAGVAAGLLPRALVAEALADVSRRATRSPGSCFLLLRADIGRPVLGERLRTANAARVDDVAVYETQRAASLPDNLLDALAAKRVQLGDLHQQQHRQQLRRAARRRLTSSNSRREDRQHRPGDVANPPRARAVGNGRGESSNIEGLVESLSLPPLSPCGRGPG